MPFPPPGNLSNPGTEYGSPARQVDSLLLCHLGNLLTEGGVSKSWVSVIYTIACLRKLWVSLHKHCSPGGSGISGKPQPLKMEQGLLSSEDHRGDGNSIQERDSLRSAAEMAQDWAWSEHLLLFFKMPLPLGTEQQGLRPDVAVPPVMGPTAPAPISMSKDLFLKESASSMGPE